MGKDDLVILDFDEIEGESEEAMKFTMPGPVWIPKSLIRDLDEDTKEVTVPVWFATKAGLV